MELTQQQNNTRIQAVWDVTVSLHDSRRFGESWRLNLYPAIQRHIR